MNGSESIAIAILLWINKKIYIYYNHTLTLNFLQVNILFLNHLQINIGKEKLWTKNNTKIVLV